MSTSKNTYFGAGALATGITSLIFSMASYGIVFLNISPKIFDQLNNLTALVFCSLTPITIILGIIGLTRKKDNILYSIIAMALVSIPALILTINLIKSLSQ